MSLMNEAGGLRYHFRALRYSKPLWQDFRVGVQSWLQDWNIPREDILLIGPSAAYTLPPQWLMKFRRRIAIEPDLVARKIFEYRFGKTRWLDVRWFDLHHKSSPFEKSDGLQRILEDYPGTPILFCNILGQVPLLCRREIARNPEIFPTWKRQFRKLLKDRSFASYHDLYSSKSDFQLADSQFNPEELWGHRSEVIDHEISDLFSDLPGRRYFKWALTPRHFHLIEGVSQVR